MNPLLFLALAVLGTSAAAMLICRLADDTYPIDDTGPVVPATDQCAVQDCPREWQNARHGTQLCHTHYRELVTDRNAS